MASLSFHGTWFSTFGALSITQNGNEVSGNYPHGGGRLQGVVDDNGVLRGTWSEPERSQQGPCELELDPAGNAFSGRWRRDNQSAWSGVWSGSRLELPPEEAGGSPGGPGSLTEGPLLAGPMLGEVGENDVRVWVQARDRSPLTLTIHRPEGPLQATLHPAWDEWLCGVFHVDGLAPGQTYEYTVSSTNGTTDRHTLRTAPPRSARKLRVAFGSCYHDYHQPLPIFDAIKAEQPDVFVMAGDNCYYYELDWQSENTMMQSQLRHRNHPQLRRLTSEVPTLGIWDDHDFGPNDSDGTFRSKTASLPVFKRVWAQQRYGTAEVTGIFSTVRMGPVEIFLLDGRYYRASLRRILGDAQLNWLMRALVTSEAPIKLVVSGSQLLPEAAVKKEWECWRRDAPEELERLFSFIDKNDVRGVVYASGDVHLGYLLHEAGHRLPGGRIGPEIWELTSSPLANDVWDETIRGSGDSDRYIMHELESTNYGIVDIDLDRHGQEVQLILKDQGGKALFEQPVPLSCLRVRTTAGEPAAARHNFSDSKLLALAWPGGKVFFFKGERYARWDPACGQPDPGYPRSIASMWRGLYPEHIDAAVVWDAAKAYFFKGSGYIAFDIEKDRAEPNCPRSIAAYWPGLWPEGIDAAVVWPGGKAFFFRGSEYIRYDIAADRADPDYPKSIASGWKGIWPEGIDSVFIGNDGKAYFFRGEEYITYDIAADRADPEGPRPVASLCPGLFGGAAIS